MNLIFEPDSISLHDKRSIVFAWLVGATLMLAATWGAVIAKISYDLQELQVRGAQRASDLTGAYAEQVQRTIKEIDQIALTVKYQWQNGSVPLDLVDQYEKAMHHTPTYPAAIGVDGKIITSWRQASIGLDLGAIDFFSYHRESDDSKLHINPPSPGVGGMKGKQTIRFTRRVNDAKGNFGGVVMVSTEPDYLASLNLNEELSEGDFISVRLIDGPPLVTRTVNGLTNAMPYFVSTPQFESSKGIRLEPGERFSDHLLRYVAWKKIDGYPLVALASVTEISAVKSYVQTKLAFLLFAVFNTALIVLVTLFGCRSQLRNAERRLKAERVRTTFRLAVEGANEAFYMIEPLRTSDGNIVDYLIEDCNERAAEMNGVPQVKMIRKRFSEIYDKETIDRLLSILNRAFAQGFLEDEFFIDENSRHQAGWFLRRAVRSGEGIALTIRDITIAKLHEETQAKLALTDTLTGLLNRRWLNEYLPGALARTRSMRQRLALLFIDLDNFKNINDTLGHAAGDELLVAAAICLKGAVRNIDYVVRLGGDEFTILIENLERDASAELVAEQVLRSFSESEIFKRWNALNVKCSIGIAVFPSHAKDADLLLHCADEAMYAAKAAGKGCYRMFKPASDKADLT